MTDPESFAALQGALATIERLRAERDAALASVEESARDADACQARAEKAEAERAELTQEVVDGLIAIRNIAAVIDRDGGQKQDGEAIERTVARCIETVTAALADVEQLRAERDALKAALTAGCRFVTPTPGAGR